MRVLTGIRAIAIAAGCASVADEYLVRRVETHAEAVAIFAAVMPEAQDGLLKQLRPWFDREWEELAAGRKPQDEIWYFREPKGGMGYRHGFAVVHAGKRLAGFTVRDEN
jgi:hypothetical protein